MKWVSLVMETHAEVLRVIPIKYKLQNLATSVPEHCMKIHKQNILRSRIDKANPFAMNMKTRTKGGIREV